MTTPVYILGGHQTDFAKVWSRNGQDISDMIREAAQAALADCRVDATAIQSIHVGNAFGELQRGQAHLGAMVAQVVPELWGVPAMRHEGACASASLAVLTAITCAPITRTIRGIRSEVEVGVPEGLPERSVISCDNLVTIPPVPHF